MSVVGAALCPGWLSRRWGWQATSWKYRRHLMWIDGCLSVGQFLQVFSSCTRKGHECKCLPCTLYPKIKHIRNFHSSSWEVSIGFSLLGKNRCMKGPSTPPAVSFTQEAVGGEALPDLLTQRAAHLPGPLPEASGGRHTR